MRQALRQPNQWRSPIFAQGVAFSQFCIGFVRANCYSLGAEFRDGLLEGPTVLSYFVPVKY